MWDDEAERRRAAVRDGLGDVDQGVGSQCLSDNSFSADQPQPTWPQPIGSGCQVRAEFGAGALGSSKSLGPLYQRINLRPT